MDDINKLREEFESIRKQNLECSENCQEELEEEFPDFIVEITIKMLSPARCGVYFSKKDIRAIAIECNEAISLKQRQTMLTHLLKSVFTYEEMQNLFSVIQNNIDHKICYYDELSSAFKSSKEIFEIHKNKAENFKKRLDILLEENK